MKSVTAKTKPFEIYCHQCQSSFAAGTRRCIHCGGRLSPRANVPFALPETRLLSGEAENVPSSLPFPVMADETEDEEIHPRRSAFSPLSAIWLVLLLGGAILQTCGR